MPRCANKYEKKEKSHFFLFSLVSIRMEVNAAQFYKGCALKHCAAEGRNRRQHGAYFYATSAWQVSPSLTEISFVSSKEIS